MVERSLKVNFVPSGKEKRGVTEARLVRGEIRGGGAAAASSPLRRPVGPRGGARGTSVASSTRTISSVATAESDFPSIYSQFGGDEVSVFSLTQPGRWHSSAAVASEPLRRPVAPQGGGVNARGASVASPTRTISSVESDFPSI